MREDIGDDVLGAGWFGGNAGNVVGEEAAAQAGAAMAVKAFRQRGGGAVVAFPPRPDWRDKLAPGVPRPGSRMYPLALTPNLNGGILTPAFPAIQFLGRPQKPFRGERLVAIVSRSAGAIGVIPQGELFVGTDLVQATAGGIPLETFVPQAFGVRMAWPGAEPGIEVRVNVTLVGVIPAGESIALSLLVMGETEA